MLDRIHKAIPRHPDTLDVPALLAFHAEHFGPARMEGDDDKSDDDAEDDKSDDDGADGDDDKSEDKADEDAGEADLGDAGKKALDRMKAKWQAERDKRKAAEAKLTAGATDDDAKGAEAIQRDADARAQAKANERIVRSEVKAAATGKVSADMIADIPKLLDLTEFEVDDDGNVDEDEIAEAIDDLISKKPSLAAQGGKKFKGGGDGGTRKETRPAQLSEADVKRLYAEKKYAEIEQAEKDGRLADILGAT